MSEEVHAMDKPKKLEVQTDGDLTEIKKDPVWKTWLEKKDFDQEERDNEGRDRENKKPTEKKEPPKNETPEQKRGRDIHEKWDKEWEEEKRKDPKLAGIERLIENFVDDKESKVAGVKPPTKKHTFKPKDAAWKTWLEKQDGPEHQAQPEEDHEPTPIEEAEQEAEEKTEQVVVGGGLNNALHLIGLSYKSWLEKDRQTKIDKPKDWWDHSKVGRQGDIDQKTGRPWWEVITEERERRKREKKKGEKIEELESDYYMDAGGNPQRKEKADYFVEEIKANVIFYDKIFPLIGMVAGQVARGLGQAGKKVGGGLLQDIGEVSQGMMEEEEEQ